MQKPPFISLLVLFLLLPLAFYCSLFYGGSGSLHWTQLNSEDFVFMQIRLPKTLSALLVGVALPTAGLLLQVLFRNPLAGPYALGISSGASLFVALSLIGSQALALPLILGRVSLIGAALIGSTSVTVLLLLLAKRIQNNVLLLLMGLTIAQICGALLSALEYFADPGDLKHFVLWGMGSLSGTSLNDAAVLALFILLCAALLLFYTKALNALLLGEDYARNLGFNATRLRWIFILISSILTGICTAYCGPIAFVGLSVPILSRLLIPVSGQQWHLLSGALMGGSLLLFADALSHNVSASFSLPVNILTTLLGAPVVLYMMFRTKQW